jgi:hypothetical protein
MAIPPALNKSKPVHSCFGGFRSLCMTRMYRSSTDQNDISCRQNKLIAPTQIGVFPETKLDAGKAGLGLAILC